MPRGVRDKIGALGEPTKRPEEIPSEPTDDPLYADLSEIGRWAVTYAIYNLPVIPCWPPISKGVCTCPKGSGCPKPGKHPIGFAWAAPNGSHSASANPQIVAGWWRKARSLGLDANVAIVPPVGEMAIDFDNWDQCAETFGDAIHDMKIAPTCRTGRDLGAHRYFHMPTDILIAMNKSFGGGETKGDGVGYVMAPPSLHELGNHYRWEQTGTIPDLPGRVAAILRTVKVLPDPHKKPQNGLFTLEQDGFVLPDTIEEGGRREWILRMTGSLRKRGILDKRVAKETIHSIGMPIFQPPLNEKEFNDRFDAIWEWDEAHPERAPAPDHVPEPVRPPRAVAGKRTKRLSAGSMRKIDWLMRGWFGAGQITICEGWGGMSKSTIMIDLIARLTMGQTWPGGLPNPMEPCDALIITGEDDPEQVLLPRLVAAGGDPERVHYWNADFVMPTDLDELREELELQPNIKFVLIDPLFSHIDSKINTGRDTEVRRLVMDPLNDVAHDMGVVIFLARHLNKSSGQEIGLKGSGSYGGLTGRARSVISVIKDPEDESGQMKLFGVHKCNYALMPKPLRFVVQDYSFEGRSVYGSENLDPEDMFPTISWRGYSPLDMDEAYEKNERARTAKGTKTRYDKKVDALHSAFFKVKRADGWARASELTDACAAGEPSLSYNVTMALLKELGAEHEQNHVVDPSLPIGTAGRQYSAWRLKNPYVSTEDPALHGSALPPFSAGSAESAGSDDWRKRRAREVLPDEMGLDEPESQESDL